jgi:hypothetical protein
MAHGRALSDDLRGIILNMARQMDIASIVCYTGQKTRTVKRVLADYRREGTVARENMAKESRLFGGALVSLFGAFCMDSNASAALATSESRSPCSVIFLLFLLPVVVGRFLVFCLLPMIR